VSTSGRVTILGLNYAPEPTGNAPYTTALAKHLQASGEDVTVFTSFPHYPQWSRYAGYSGWRSSAQDSDVDLVRLAHWIPNPPRGWRRLASELSFGLRLAFTRWRRPNVVVLVSPALFSSWIAMMRLVLQRRPKRVVWVQDLYSQGMAEMGEGGGAALRVVRAVERWTLRRAHTVVAIHETMAARMTTTLGVDASRVVVIPNWSHVTPSDSTPEAAKSELGWPPTFTVLHAGNMGLKQGLEVIVEAARAAADDEIDVRFVLLGDGGERKSLQRAAEGLPNLGFVDPLDAQAFPIALAAADVLVVTEAPGVAEMAAPSKLTSYFAAARPVIASVSPTGIVAQIMADSGAGPVVPGGDGPALLAGIKKVAEDADLWARAAASAHAYWQRNLGPAQALTTWERVVQATILGEAYRGDQE